ncbi:hypothetical protein ACIPY6_42835 [Streptomyces sp. NPDC090054]|uniref:hypothetical protein n=1 Tax=Streptomyces sp. NPDC090054 TaxID=3365933 RepID=UPI0038080DA4
MSAQSIHPHEPHRVPRNAAGIASALPAEQRTAFYEELLAATPDEAKGVLLRWWGRAMLDTDPAQGARVAAALAGQAPTMPLAELLERRRAAGLTVD